MSALLARFRRIFIALLAAACAVAGVAALGSQPAGASYPSTSFETSVASALFSQLNQERAANHLYALASDPYMRTGSAAYHSRKMAYYNQMSHQISVPGWLEPPLSVRVTNAGFKPWSYLGENVAWTTDISVRGAQALQTTMYNEVAPNDGHRRNILSTNYQYVGVNAYVDYTHNKLWLTFDFGRQ